MGVDISATHTLFFIAAVVLAVGTVGVFNQSVQKFNGEVGTRSTGLADELSTDVRIINDPAEITTSPVTVYVMNTGSSTLSPGESIVLLDGAPHTDLAFDVIADDDDVEWAPGQVLQITLTGSNLGNGDHRLKVVVQHGVADILRFTI